MMRSKIVAYETFENYNGHGICDNHIVMYQTKPPVMAIEEPFDPVSWRRFECCVPFNTGCVSIKVFLSPSHRSVDNLPKFVSFVGKREIMPGEEDDYITDI